MDIATRDAFTRTALDPRLAIPLVPAHHSVWLLRRLFTGLSGPDFRRANRRTLQGLPILVACLTGVLVTDHSVAALTLVAVTSLIVIARVIVLARLELRQSAFEREWLDRRTAELRSTCFEIIRIRLTRRAETGTDDGPAPTEDPADVDLSPQDDLGAWIRARELDDAEAVRWRVTLEIAYGPDSLGEFAVRSISAPLSSITLVADEGLCAPGYVRFPRAVYLPHAIGKEDLVHQTAEPVLLGPIDVGVRSVVAGAR